MRPLRYSVNVTLDGCIDHSAGTPPDEESHRHAAATIERADSLILGRNLYQLMEFWRDPPHDAPAWTQPFAATMNRAHKYLVSSTVKADPDWNAEQLCGNVVDAVRELKQQPGQGLYVGGLTLARTLANAQLIDEYELVVHSQIAGRGPRLFDQLTNPLDLTLVEQSILSSGVRALRYVPTQSNRKMPGPAS